MRPETHRWFARRWPPVFLCAALATLATLVGCTKGAGAEEAKPDARRGERGGGGRGGRGGPPVVEVIRVERRNLANVVSVPVVLEGRRQVEVYPRVTGRVTAIARRTGESVARGGTLFSVDRSEPGESFLSAPVVSPIAGKVAEWYVSEGDQITSGSPAVLVVDDSALRAKIPLPVSEWQNVTPEAKVTLTVDGVTKDARILTVSRAVQATAGKGTVEVEVDNGGLPWKAGFSADAMVSLAPKPRTVAPARALLLTSDGAFVYAVREGVAKRLKVTFRPRSPDEIELLDDALGDGADVVVSGTGRLADGTPVRVAEGRGGGGESGRGGGGSNK